MDTINDKYGDFVITPTLMMGMDEVIIDRIAFGGVKELEVLLLSLEQTYKLRWRVCHNRLHGKCILPSSYQLARRPPVSCL
jgi:hypothetical protein